jgi:hypothetical protein
LSVVSRFADLDDGRRREVRNLFPVDPQHPADRRLVHARRKPRDQALEVACELRARADEPDASSRLIFERRCPLGGGWQRDEAPSIE